MTSRERVLSVIEGRPADRTPVYGWVRANLEEEIADEFGSVEAFEDWYGFDLAHLFGGPQSYDPDAVAQLRAETGGAITPPQLLELPMADPNMDSDYDDLRQQLEHHKTRRGRWVYVQTPGIFEAHNGYFGIENHLMYLALYPEDLRRVYQRQVEWTKQFIDNCLDLNIDMIHISDDWGAQETLMFNPKTWREMIYPYHRQLTTAVKGRNTRVSLHSDGNIMQVVDEVIQLGYDVVHPWQESAGMSLEAFRDKYRDSFVVMGGLDVQTTIGFGKVDFLQDEIRRVLGMFADGGLLFCTTHFVQDHCSMAELRLAFDTVREITGQ